MKIYHAADIHLGRNRLDGRLPDQDLAVAFRRIAEAAAADRADLFLLAGDLFDRPQVEPQHLRQAQEVLQSLRAARIPVAAIEGNHDKTFVHAANTTWLGYLAEEGLLQLLRPQFGPMGAILTPCDPRTGQGSYADHGGFRFVGAGYLGAATPAKVRQILAALDDALPIVLLLHAGPDYFVGEGGGFAKEDLALLEQRVSYLALGHIHRPMVHGGWACNPGSPENGDVHEAAYSRDKTGAEVGRGYAVVELDPRHPGKPVSLQVRSNVRRPVLRVDLDCTAFGNKIKEGAAALVHAAVSAIAKHHPGAEAVIDLRLTGALNLNRIALDQERAAAAISEEAKVFAVALDASNLNLAGRDGAAGNGAAALPREELERRAICQLVEGDPPCGLIGETEAFANLFFNLKTAVHTGKEPQEMADWIANHALVEKIRVARETAKAGREVGGGGV